MFNAGTRTIVTTLVIVITNRRVIIPRGLLPMLLGVCVCLALARPACAAVRYVDSGALPSGDGLSWSTAYDSLSTALAAAQPGDQIWVATGTYVGNFTLALGVQVYGGFAGTETELSQRDWPVNRTILDGNQGGCWLPRPPERPRPPGSTASPSPMAAPVMAADCTWIPPPRRSPTTRSRGTAPSPAAAADCTCDTPPRLSLTTRSRGTVPSRAAVVGCTWMSPRRRSRTTRSRATAPTMAAGCACSSTPPRLSPTIRSQVTAPCTWVPSCA